MELQILRHGIAEDLGPAWGSDEQRPLTDEGRKKTREVGIGLVALEVAPDAIFTSPLVRARETAEIVARELKAEARLKTLPLLAPGSDLEELLRALGAAAPLARSIMVVGHEPSLGMLVSRLLCGDARALETPLKKAGLARVEVDALPPSGRGTLVGFYGPGPLRAAGRGGR
jgi:phosphohistidine phosphatase